MCTLVLLRRPDHLWPLILLANRNEMGERPSRAPTRHWPDRPQLVGGLDQLAGGSWMGLNDFGVFACVLNRRASLGPAEGFRSRGELPLEALDHADAQTAAAALAAIAPTAYRPFNLVIGDALHAFWIRADGENLAIAKIPEKVSMLSAADLNDIDASPRQRHFLPLFQSAAPPDPDRGDWTAWEALATSPAIPANGQPSDAMAFMTEGGFGTLSSSLLALPAPSDPKRTPVWRYASEANGLTVYEEVDLA